MSQTADKVASHYARDDLAERILAYIEAQGVERATIGLEQLSAYDEFHIRGREATVELLARAGFAEGMAVLDVGCGIGGPARFLASTAGCWVTGLDLTPAFCETARLLNDHLGLAGQVEIHQGNALAMPFAVGVFDGAWMLHAAMNIADKAWLYREIARVLKPGAVFAGYEILQGEGGAALYPAPWAEEPSISHLVAPAEWRKHLEAAGFSIEGWRDLTVPARDWFALVAERITGEGPATFRMSLLQGDNFRDKVANMCRNTAEGRIAIVEAICRKG